MKSKEEKKPKDKKTDYSFLLKCMAGLTAAALVTAGVLAIVAAKASTTVGAAGFVAASTIVGGPIGTIAAIIGLTAIISAACLLPFLFGAGRNSVVYTTPSRPYYNRGWGLFGPTAAYIPAYNGPVHTHGGSVFGSGGTTHTHRTGGFGGGTTHTHGGGVFGGGATTHTSGGGIFGRGATTHTHGGGIFGGGATAHTRSGGFGGASHHGGGATVHAHSGPRR